jgi:hypothetical protein
MIALADVLKKAGRQPVCLGDKALILPFGARVLGLYPKEDLNVFYVQQELESPDSARTLLGGSSWMLLGGDRTWISPEVETIGDFGRSPETYEVPKAMDPGRYQVVSASDTEVTLQCDMELHFKMTGGTAQFQVTRTAALLERPDLPEGVSSAGYALDVTLQVRSPLPEGAKPALWDLVQVRKGGTMIVPVKSNVRPRTFFGEPICQMEGSRVLCDVPTAKHFKFAVHADHCCGIHAYLNTAMAPATLVVQTFGVSDGSRYTDVPSDDYKDTGYPQEIYVDDGALGGFGEIEHHTPALGFDESTEIKDHSETFAFAGPEKALREIMERMIQERLKEER